MIDNNDKKNNNNDSYDSRKIIYCWDKNHALGRITIPEWWDVAERLINVL